MGERVWLTEQPYLYLLPIRTGRAACGGRGASTEEQAYGENGIRTISLFLNSCMLFHGHQSRALVQKIWCLVPRQQTDPPPLEVFFICWYLRETYPGFMHPFSFLPFLALSTSSVRYRRWLVQDAIKELAGYLGDAVGVTGRGSTGRCRSYNSMFILLRELESWDNRHKKTFMPLALDPGVFSLVFWDVLTNNKNSYSLAGSWFTVIYLLTKVNFLL